ncbi:MAG TPA: hypothetical protein VM534_09880 [Thermoanaerobaculia bacterium]|nr:hypothetical protein [Thermoanaerobaculia bacterium]
MRFRAPFLIILALTLVGSFSLPADTLEPFADQIEAVEQIRGHRFLAPVSHRSIPRAELRGFLRDHMEKMLPVSTEDYFAILNELGLIEDSSGALESLLGLYEAQVLAFYDPFEHVYYSIEPTEGTKEPLEGAALSMMTEFITVHELTHALQDQVFGAGRKLEAVSGNWDAELAYQAVIEGEATLVMIGSLVRTLGMDLADLSLDALTSSLGDLAMVDLGVPDQTPPYFIEALQFPYLDGLRFVAEAYRRDGWKGVDQLHARPPLTTAEILHPELYYDRIDAQERALPAKAEGPASLLLATSLGEFHWRFLLGETAAEGWSSDHLTLSRGDGGSLAVASRSSWRNEEEAREFAETYRAFLAKRGVAANVSLEGDEVITTWPTKSSAPSP